VVSVPFVKRHCTCGSSLGLPHPPPRRHRRATSTYPAMLVAGPAARLVLGAAPPPRLSLVRSSSLRWPATHPRHLQFPTAITARSLSQLNRGSRVYEAEEPSAIDRLAPAVLRGRATRWAAIARWRDAEYLCRNTDGLFGPKQVRVECSDSGAFGTPAATDKRISIEALFSELLASKEAADIYATNLCIDRDLDESLRADVAPLPPFVGHDSGRYCPLTGRFFPFLNVWIGRGSTTPLHWDDADNWIVQVCQQPPRLHCCVLFSHLTSLILGCFTLQFAGLRREACAALLAEPVRSPVPGRQQQQVADRS
jgi:hypothetical protein